MQVRFALLVFASIAGSLATASSNAISDWFDIAKELIDGSWDHEDNLDIAASDAGLPSALCIGHFCSVDGQPGPQC